MPGQLPGTSKRPASALEVPIKALTCFRNTSTLLKCYSVCCDQVKRGICNPARRPTTRGRDSPTSFHFFPNAMCDTHDLHEPHKLIMRLSMENTKTSSEAASRPSPGRRTPRRKSAKKHRETPSRSRNTTPRSSPSRYPASPKKTPYSPVKIRGGEDGEGTLVSNRTLADMQIAKRNYLGRLEWAKGEEQLFEILFLREDIPLLPLHWEVDFRGVPISGDCFCCKKGEKPIIYAHTSTFLGQRLL